MYFFSFAEKINMDAFLQTNNDLILSIHKALIESTQEINRKIESLRDDVRDVKLSLAKNDRIMQEEATNWRRHTETIVKELGDRYQNDISGLHKLLMELCIRTSPALPIQPTVAVIKPTKEEEDPVVKPVEVAKTFVKTDEPVGFQPLKANEPLGFRPPKEFETKTFVPPVVSAVVIPPVVPAVVSTASPAPINFLFKENDNKPVPLVSSVVSSAPAPVNFSFKEKDNKTVAPPAVSTTVSAVPTAPVSFSFKTPAAATVTSSTTPITSTSTVTSSPSGPIGGSLFGGASRPGTNTFANLAAKAAESGYGFLGSAGGGAGKVPEAAYGFLGAGNATGKPQFGQSAFGAASAKDFKIFQQPPSQPIFGSTAHVANKPADESHKGEDGSDKEDAADEFVPDVHYEPVVPLPPEVEVSTGEEEEEVMFSARCKLYRFDKEARENKERGLGDIKLLYDPRSSRYRCVMRREQVFKLCANFPIYPDLKIHPREHMPTVYTWACKDFSDDPSQGTDVTLSARFKDKAIADEFYEKMMEAVEKSS